MAPSPNRPVRCLKRAVGGPSGSRQGRPAHERGGVPPEAASLTHPGGGKQDTQTHPNLSQRQASTTTTHLPPPSPYGDQSHGKRKSRGRASSMPGPRKVCRSTHIKGGCSGCQKSDARGHKSLPGTASPRGGEPGPARKQRGVHLHQGGMGVAQGHLPLWGVWGGGLSGQDCPHSGQWTLKAGIAKARHGRDNTGGGDQDGCDVSLDTATILQGITATGAAIPQDGARGDPATMQSKGGGAWGCQPEPYRHGVLYGV